MTDKQIRFLVVDIDSAVYKVVKEYSSTRSDLVVEVVHSLKDAEEHFSNSDIDAYIIEGKFLEESREDQLAGLRSRYNIKGKIVLVLSQFFREEITSRMQNETGADYVICHPISQRRIAALMDYLTNVVEEDNRSFVAHNEAFLKQIYRIERIVSNLMLNPMLESIDVLVNELDAVEQCAIEQCYRIVTKLIQEIKGEIRDRLVKSLPVTKEWLCFLGQLCGKIVVAYELEVAADFDGVEFMSKADANDESNLGIDVYFVGNDKKLLALTAEKASALGIRFIIESDPVMARDLLEKKAFYPRVLIVNKDYPDSDVSGFDLVKIYRNTHGEHAGSSGMIFEEGEIDARVQAMQKGVEVFVGRPFAINKLLEVCQLELSLKKSNDFKVLVLDSDQEVCDFIINALSEINIYGEAFNEGAELFNRLERFNPDLLIMDIQLPDYDGINLLRVLRSDFYYKDLPVIIITKESGESYIEEAYRIGIDDYIIKPLVHNVFKARIFSFTQKVVLQSVVRDRDSMTGLLNRRSFIEQFQISLWRCLRNHSKMAFALIDLDFFKDVNDQYGHTAGDEVLVRFSRMLTGAFRRSDLIGRWGGEEFAILLEDITLSQAYNLISRLLNEYQHESLLAKYPNFRITFSCGIAGYPEGGANLEELYRAADKALYVAKSRGRNCVVTVPFNDDAS